MDTRRSYQCHKTNCDSQALHQLKIHLPTLGRDMEMTCLSSIKVCDRHKRQAEEYVLSPENKTAISIRFLCEKLPPPDFTAVRSEWVPVVEGEMIEGAA